MILHTWGYIPWQPKVTVMENGSKLVSFALSTDSEDPKARDQEPKRRETVRVSFFLRKEGKFDQYLKVGTNVAITGRLYTNEYQGKTQLNVDCDPKMVRLLPSSNYERKEGEQQAPAQQANSGATPPTPENDPWNQQ